MAEPSESMAPGTDDLVQDNLGFVMKVAGSYRNMGVPFEDLMNEGTLGLIEAAQRFDRSRGVHFITYANWWIRKAILKAVARQTLVSISEHRRRQVRSVVLMGRALTRTLGREAGREEISRALRLTIEETDQLVLLAMKDLSLDQTVKPGGDATLLDGLVDRRSASPEAEMIGREDARLLRRALRRLSPLQRMIIAGRFGLSGRRVCTLGEIGDRLGFSRERVRQIEVVALKILRKELRRTRPPSQRKPSRATTSASPSATEA